MLIAANNKIKECELFAKKTIDLIKGIDNIDTDEKCRELLKLLIDIDSSLLLK